MADQDIIDRCYIRAVELVYHDNEAVTCRDCQVILVKEFGPDVVSKMLSRLNQVTKTLTF